MRYLPQTESTLARTIFEIDTDTKACRPPRFISVERGHSTLKIIDRDDSEDNVVRSFSKISTDSCNFNVQSSPSILAHFRYSQCLKLIIFSLSVVIRCQNVIIMHLILCLCLNADNTTYIVQEFSRGE